MNIGSDSITFHEAVIGSEKNLWQAAIKEELDSLNKNKTWELVKRQGIPKSKILPSKWIFRKKVEPNRGIRYKARLTVRGFQERHEYDIKEAYSPVIRLTDFRFLPVTANKFNLKMSQMDVKTAFLNGELENEIFTFIPEGVIEKEELEKNYANFRRLFMDSE